MVSSTINSAKSTRGVGKVISMSEFILEATDKYSKFKDENIFKTTTMKLTISFYKKNYSNYFLQFLKILLC